MSGLRRAIVPVVALLLACAAGARAAEPTPPLRTHYDVTVVDDQGRYGIGGSADLRAGVPLEFTLTRYRIGLLAELDADDHYRLSVSVSRTLQGVTGGIETPRSQTFGGQIGLPLSFRMIDDDLSVDGAIVISRP